MKSAFSSVLAASLTCALLLTAFSPVRGQEALTPGVSVTGSIDSGETTDYTFNGTSGEVISLMATAADSDLDPVITLLDANGTVLLTNDDYAYPQTRAALLEAITLPRTGSYTVRLNGFDDSAGAFTLTLHRGFAIEQYADDFAANVGWSAEDARIRVTGGALTITYTGQSFVTAFATESPQVTPYFARVRVTTAQAVGGDWLAGLSATYDDSTYAMIVRANGTWRFVRRDGAGETVIRDWSTHPAIVAGQTAFSVSMLARNDGIHAFYNDSLLAMISVPEADGAAQIGPVAGVQAAVPGDATVTFDDLVVTTPLLAEGVPVLPDRVYVSDAQTMVQMLTRRHLVPITGQLTLTVPESSVQFARAGVNRLMLGGGTTYGQFALGAQITLQQNTVGLSGCGLVFRSLSEDDYALAFFDSTGSAGLSLQEAGEFQPGLFVPGDDDAVTRHLLVIADSTTLQLYVDGVSAGVLPMTAVAGEVGGAVINYDAVDTLCTFRNLWVWRWEG